MLPEIIVTDVDVDRLQDVIEQYGEGRHAQACDALDTELARARVVQPGNIDPDIVTMNSTIRYVEDETGKEQVVTLVYPQNADIENGKLSILAPVGLALLGLRVGQSIEWKVPSGRTSRLRILELLFQPEAAGQYHL